MEHRDANQTWDPPEAHSGTDVPPLPEVPLPPWPLPAAIAYAGLGIRALALVIDALASLVVAIPSPHRRAGYRHQTAPSARSSPAFRSSSPSSLGSRT
jgi:hypothetical protein